MTPELVKKRRMTEMGRLEAWLSQGRGSFHLENLHIVRTLLAFLLAAMRLRARGEQNAQKPRLNAITIALPDLPEEFEGYTILHLSDLHLDGVAGLGAYLAKMLAPLRPDLCVMTGDYRFEIDGPCRPACREMAEVLPHIHARDGIMAVLGNHDFYDEAEFLSALGVGMLLNESALIWRGDTCLCIAGVDDPHYYGTDDLDAALSGVPRNALVVLLAHSPELYREAAGRGVALYLCGHTHAGQIALPLVGALLVNADCPRRMAAGLWRHKHMTGFTSAGTGASLVPVRFHCPGEVVLITLTRGQSSEATTERD
jgi:predicted MPP superfamily phosphohydrolase